MFALDLFAMAMVWPLVLAWADGAPGAPRGAAPFIAAQAYPAANLMCLYALGLYRRDVTIWTRRALGRVPPAALLGSLVGGAAVGLALWGDGVADWQVRLGTAALAAFLAAAAGARVVFHVLRRGGIIRRRVLVVGAGVAPGISCTC